MSIAFCEKLARLKGFAAITNVVRHTWVKVSFVRKGYCRGFERHSAPDWIISTCGPKDWSWYNYDDAHITKQGELHRHTHTHTHCSPSLLTYQLLQRETSADRDRAGTGTSIQSEWRGELDLVMGDKLASLCWGVVVSGDTQWASMAQQWWATKEQRETMVVGWSSAEKRVTCFWMNKNQQNLHDRTFEQTDLW